MIHNLEEPDISKNISVNITMPFALSSFVLKLSKENSLDPSIINISSGVSKKPIEGWSLYCSTKAALNMLTYCLAEEEGNLYTIAINPGPLDTEMQKNIRDADTDKSPISQQFRIMKAEGKLKSPEIVAKRIIVMSFNKEHQSGNFVDFNLL